MSERLFEGLDKTGPVPPYEIFREVYEFVRRFVQLGYHEATAVTLWVMMTHVFEQFECVPYLWITSAEKQSGKTTLLEVLDFIVARPWLTGRTTAAVLTRKIDKEHPSLLFDESDATFRGDKEFAETLRGILNSGYRRSGKTSVCVMKGKSIEYADLSTFCPKAIAGIGDIPDTVVDRSVPIRLTRKLSTESVEKFRHKRVQPQASVIRERLEAWGRAFEAADNEPAGLDDLPDRAADICEPLLVIAEACGPEVAASAHEGLVVLCGRQREDESRGIRILSDIRSVFADDNTDRISSEVLASRLAAIEESPWGPSRFNKPFDPRALAKMLKPFGIKPQTIRLDDSTPRGYHRSDFADAWARYLPSPEKAQQAQQAQQAFKIEVFSTLVNATQAPQEQQLLSEPPQNGRARSSGPADLVADVPQRWAEPQREKAHEIRDVADVADVAVPGGMRGGDASPLVPSLFEEAAQVIDGSHFGTTGTRGTDRAEDLLAYGREVFGSA